MSANTLLRVKPASTRVERGERDLAISPKADGGKKIIILTILALGLIAILPLTAYSQELYNIDHEGYSGSIQSSGWSGWEGTPYCAVNQVMPYSGNYGFQIHWAPGIGWTGPERSGLHIDQGEIIHCRYYVYYSPGFIFGSPCHKKTLRFNTLYSPVVYTSIIVSANGLLVGHNNIYNSSPDHPDGWFYQNIESPVYFQGGQWYCVELATKHANDGTGWMRMWVDGELKLDYDNLSLGSDYIEKVRYAQQWNEGSPQDQYEYVDDVIIYESEQGLTNFDAFGNPFIGPVYGLTLAAQFAQTQGNQLVINQGDPLLVAQVKISNNLASQANDILLYIDAYNEDEVKIESACKSLGLDLEPLEERTFAKVRFNSYVAKGDYRLEVGVRNQSQIEPINLFVTIQ